MVFIFMLVTQDLYIYISHDIYISRDTRSIYLLKRVIFQSIELFFQTIWLLFFFATRDVIS